MNVSRGRRDSGMPALAAYYAVAICLALAVLAGRASGGGEIEKARHYSLVGDWQRAAGLYEEASAGGLGREDMDRLAEAYYYLGKTDKAAEVIDRALKLSDSLPTRILRALVDAQREAPEGPLSVLSRMLSGGRDDFRVYAAMGMISMRSDTKKALEYFNRSIELNPDCFDAWYYSGVIHEEAEEFEEATKAYQQAVKINPLFARAQNNLGYSFKERHFYAYAVERYLKAIELMPDHAGFYYNLGNAYTHQEKIDEAFEAYRKAVELEPSFAKAHYNLGRTYLRKDKVREAINEFRLYLKYGNSAVFSFVSPAAAVEDEISQLEYYLKYNSARPTQKGIAR
ncbi:MAG: tetratricopeptide repeat protein [Nitrospiraceae bacterium]|nr:tetratricopeptide repeat protein [Nitrospiraceae bacterium]